jgi:hypothetical protein
MRYPRAGEAIVPKLLRPLVIERRPAAFRDRDSDRLFRLDLGPGAWTRLPADECQRLAMVVVDRIQTRVHALPTITRNHPLPDPWTAVKLPIERRTANTIRKGMHAGAAAGPWTVGRYLALPRFGGRALVDLLAAIEARSDLTAGLEAAVPEALAGSGNFASERALDAALSLITQRLPISEGQANAELVRGGLVDGPVDLGLLSRTAVRLGRNAPFHIIEMGGTRMVVRLADVTTARASYRIAIRAVQGWGTATIRAVASQLRLVVHAVVAAPFVEQLLVGTTGFRWLDRQQGWFWFAQGRNPLVDDLRKIFSVATRLAPARLWAALFRNRQGPPASAEAIRQLCLAVPGTRVADDMVTIDRPFDRRAHLTDAENRVTRLLEKAPPEGMSESQIRRLVRTVGLPWTTVWRLLRSSPVVERSANDLYRLLGSPG